MRLLFASMIEGLWGGSEVLWSRTAIHAADNGHQIAAFFPYYKDIPQTRELAEHGIRLHYGSRVPTRWWLRLGQAGQNRIDSFRSLLVKTAPDLVVINQGSVRDGLEQMAVCRDAGVPYVILNQAVEPLHYDDSDWKVLREGFGGARTVWCVSAENLADLRAYLGLPLAQARALTNAYACPLNPDTRWPESSTWRLALVGRLYLPQKRQDLLLDALAMAPWNERPVRFTLFGEGPALEQLLCKRDRLGLRCVDIPGRSADVGEIWRTHHVFVQSSRFEGQSLAMLEAMLHARPVVSTPVGGTRDVVLDGKNGMLTARTEDVVSLAEALERAWAERSRWQQMGESARAHILGIVSPDPGRDFFEKLSV
jgi:glycosyltransferase involved in cell wall biosynthesis